MDNLEQQVADKAERAVDQLRDRSNDTLDYSDRSLVVVDEILAEASEFINDLPADQIDALTRMIGSYILEVGRREFGGRYCWHDDRDQPVLVVGEPKCRIALLAFDKVRDRLHGDHSASIPFFYDGFASRARIAKPNDDALYV